MVGGGGEKRLPPVLIGLRHLSMPYFRHSVCVDVFMLGVSFLPNRHKSKNVIIQGYVCLLSLMNCFDLHIPTSRIDVSLAWTCHIVLVITATTSNIRHKVFVRTCGYSNQ